MAAVGINGRRNLRTIFLQIFRRLTHASVVIQKHTLPAASAVDPPIRGQQTKVATASVHVPTGGQLTFNNNHTNEIRWAETVQINSKNRTNTLPRTLRCHQSGTVVSWGVVMRWPTEQACNYHSYLLIQITHATSAIKWSGAAFPTL